ncbi:aldo/keto reductase [Streptomyces zagrosensis]|uniref:Aryl-alcohol dehydrogenase-like predicted oxidoreductase n=1 Tax=Streptomyces zagrosensis TaxID=1042984 RepID=A0A7W9UYH5_9ACTN|nr:aldo/keto reductase [Streptomyces zagrosensis]MBB5934799.1 aryl-alcohol dehydrogenase-like predicted oxidoreductase [Streptomyces zagrosensis]
MKYRTLGSTTVSAIGLGAMPLSIEHRPDEERAVATIHAALDAGVTLIDTADSYHWHADERGHNELLIARALARYGGDTSHVLVATKGGRGRPGDGSWTVTGTPAHLKDAAEASRKRLGVEAIGLYQVHKPDPDVPWAESVGALRDLLDAGTIRAAGVSNVTTGQISEAHAILGVSLVSVQNEFSPATRDAEPALELSTRLGLAFLPWSPLGGISRSSLDGPSGTTSAGTTSAGTASAGTAFHHIAAEHGVSPQQIALAWLLARSPAVIPIPGSSRPASIQDSAGATEIELKAAELAQLDAALPKCHIDAPSPR